MRRTKLMLGLILITTLYWGVFVNILIHITMFYELMVFPVVLINIFGNFFLCFAYALDWEDDFKNSQI